jgi:hypothetical protein
MIFVGDDWAEDHHDVHLMDETGARLASRRLPDLPASASSTNSWPATPTNPTRS